MTLCKMPDALCTTTDYLLTGKGGMSDVTAITTLLERVDKPFLIGAKMLLKGNINSISFIKSKVAEQEKEEN